MAATQQPPPPAAWPPGQPCPSCGAPLAADQRYCLSCGTRRGEPRVSPAAAPAPGPEATAPPPGRPADVSPLAAVIGIALLGGMLLIGVLIGRGDTSNNQPPAPVVQVGDQTATIQPATTTGGSSTTSTTAAAGAVTSEWPEGTNGFTVQLSTLPQQGTTADAVDAAKASAADSGVKDAAVLDSNLYTSLPPDTYVIYSGVYTQQKQAQKALTSGALLKNFPSALVVEVSSKASAQPPVPESEVPPPAGPGKGSATTGGLSTDAIR
jgi:hypothetical protein